MSIEAATKERKLQLAAGMEAEEEEAVNNCLCCRVSPLTLKRMSTITLLFILAEVVCTVIVLVIIFMAGQQEFRTRAIIFCLSLLIAVFTGAYGSIYLDRGWVMVCLLTQMWILAAITPYFYDSLAFLRASIQYCTFALAENSPDCGRQFNLLVLEVAVAIVVFFLAVAVAWATLRFEELIAEEESLAKQEESLSYDIDGEHHEDHGLQRPRKVKCCGLLPDQTVRSLARWIYASSVVSAVIVVAMIVFGIYSSDQENQIYTIFVAVSLTLALATALYGALMRDRGFLMLSFVLHLWYMAMVNAFLYDGWAERASLRAACALIQTNAAEDCSTFQPLHDAQWAVAAVSLFTTLSAAWLCLRTSEKIQEKETDSKLAWKCAGFTLDMWGIAKPVVVKILLFLMTVAVVLAIMLLLLMAFTTKTETALNGGVMGVALIVACFVGVYGVRNELRGWIFLFFVVTTWILQASFRYFYGGVLRSRTLSSTCRFEQIDCGNAQQLSVVDVALTLCIFFVGVPMSFLSLNLAEHIEDERNFQIKADHQRLLREAGRATGSSKEDVDSIRILDSSSIVPGAAMGTSNESLGLSNSPSTSVVSSLSAIMSSTAPSSSAAPSTTTAASSAAYSSAGGSPTSSAGDASSLSATASASSSSSS